MTKKKIAPVANIGGKHIQAVTHITPSGQAVRTIPTGSAATSGFNVVSGTPTSGNLYVTGGATGVTFGKGDDLIVGGTFDDGSWNEIYGLVGDLDDEYQKKLIKFFELVDNNEDIYKGIFPVIRGIYQLMEFGGVLSESTHYNRFAPLPEEIEILLDYFRKDMNRVVSILTKQSIEILPLLKETYPTQDVEIKFMEMFSMNYVCKALDKHNIKWGSNDVNDLFGNLKVVDAYPVDVYDEENVAEFGHIEFGHRVTHKIIEFDITIYHNNDKTIEYFDSESQKNGDELGIELNKETLDYVLERYDQYF